MKLADVFQELEKKYPQRKPGSPGLVSVAKEVGKHISALGLETNPQKIPVFNFHISLLIYIIGSLILISLSFYHPLAGFLTTVLLYLLFLGEMIRPTLALAKAIPAENLIVTIPARSKEIQKIIIETTMGTDSFIEPPSKLPNRIYLTVVYLLGLAGVICLGLNQIFQFKLLLFLAFGFMLGLIYLKLSTHRPNLSPSLNNCAVLIELAQILVKDRPFRTSVTLLFHASNSLNSGILKIPKMLDNRLSFNYVIDILNLPDKRIQIVTADGAFIPMNGDPLLAEFVIEVAHAKNIPVQEIKIDQITAAYPLKFKKINTISIANPLNQNPETDPGKDLRELLMGLIRKLD
jgi:hypothetical protein